MNNTPLPHRRPVLVENRVAAFMIHIPWYSFRGISRLACDADVAKSALWRLLQGPSNPSYHLLFQVAEALSRQMGQPLDLREVAVERGKPFPTKYPCSLFNCRCLPDWAYTPDDSLRPAWRGIRPGEWTNAYPSHLLED